MANYFVINSKFKPYSFDELLKPYQLYGQAYKEQEEIIDAAREKEFSPELLDKEQDAEVYNIYNAANEQLRALSDELADGFISNRSKVRAVARDYKRTMEALNDAQSRLYAERDRRAKSGNDYIYQKDDIRIGDFMYGKSPNQKSESLTGIAQDIATDFAQRAKSITKDTWGKVIGQNGKVIAGFYDIATEQGLTNAQLDTILSDSETWNRIMSDQSISREEKDNLQRFRDIISAKRDAIEYNKYSPESQAKINNAIIRGASAGLGTVTHKHQQDPGYNPLGWSKWESEKLEAEAPYTHSDENNPTPANRTGLKPGYSIKNGKLQYNSDTDGSGNGASTRYTTTTPQITIHTKNGTSTFASWKDAYENDNVKKKIVNLPTVAIEDVTDPAIQRALLARINVPSDNMEDATLPMLISKYLDRLNQLTVQISGNPNEPKNYVWAISDKKTQRLAGEGPEEDDDKIL